MARSAGWRRPGRTAASFGGLAGLGRGARAPADLLGRYSGAGPGDVVAVDRAEVGALCRAALDAAGASLRVAELLTDAALFAEDRGKAVVGVAHLLDHRDAMDDGRLDGRAVPRISRPSPAVTTSDARGGIAHNGFDEGFAGLVEAARGFGVAVFAQHGSYTCGQLGWFTERLAAEGLVAVATAASPALLAAGPGTGRLFGTNPVACSVRHAGRPPLTVDQASSSTAFVTVRDAAARGTRPPRDGPWTRTAVRRRTPRPPSPAHCCPSAPGVTGCWIGVGAGSSGFRPAGGAGRGRARPGRRRTAATGGLIGARAVGRPAASPRRRRGPHRE